MASCDISILICALISLCKAFSKPWMVGWLHTHEQSVCQKLISGFYCSPVISSFLWDFDPHLPPGNSIIRLSQTVTREAISDRPYRDHVLPNTSAKKSNHCLLNCVPPESQEYLREEDSVSGSYYQLATNR